ncbi:sigma factor-like helix-turn-helix DNA-binding protein [Streptomyces sp. NPDC087844]|uniref:sigma factor-like helix-turn-helix DNA-binding protein n=1 Tax=Streptomyces sp. NPDC087844 TaxID=3365805 RepID=UPI003807F146
MSTLLRLANLLTGGDRHEAEDLARIALMKAQPLAAHRGPEGCVRKVMYRQQISRWRLRRPHREPTFAAPPADFGVADGTPAADLRITVGQALARLTPRQRTMLVLRYFEDLSETEVAAVRRTGRGTRLLPRRGLGMMGGAQREPALTTTPSVTLTTTPSVTLTTTPPVRGSGGIPVAI